MPGGPTYREAQLCMEMIADTGQLASLDVMELNPALDVRNRTAQRRRRPDRVAVRQEHADAALTSARELTQQPLERRMQLVAVGHTTLRGHVIDDLGQQLGEPR